MARIAIEVKDATKNKIKRMAKDRKMTVRAYILAALGVNDA